MTLSRTVFIIPDTPSPRSNKQREVERYAEVSPPTFGVDGPVPEYHESASPGEGSGSGSWSVTGEGSHGFSIEDLEERGEEEEEYDGYEELSASLSTRVPPPTIDEDVSPPDAEMEDSDPPPTIYDESFTSVPTSPTHPNSAILLPSPSGPFTDDHSTSSSPPTLSPSLPISLSLSSLILSSSHSDSTSSDSAPPTPHLHALPPPYAGNRELLLPNGEREREEEEEPGSTIDQEQVDCTGPTQPPPYTTHHHALVGLTMSGHVVELV